MAKRKARYGFSDTPKGGGSAARCQDCGKLAFSSRQSAKRGAARIWPGQRMRAYQCGSWWHVTSQDAQTVARYRDADAVREV